MVLRITTWNVNGIRLSELTITERNPFGYQPWREKRTFDSMFDILEADIVVMQETKIQRKDLRDDMVLVPGWDCFFSLPKHKKGYSGVAIYTRQSVCAPVRAEEGITGILTPPSSSTSFRDLPPEQRIGGYPSAAQLAESSVDAATLDSEGRCVVLEFPAFVLIGVYSPANRDDTRDDFRLGFVNAFDARVRNLVAEGKNVILTGDLNISRGEIDTAHAEEALKKHEITVDEFVSTPARRIFNQLLFGGKVVGNKDEGRDTPVLWDICRVFHEGRRGMYTCWEQKKNARPGNFGARIDYVLCSPDMKEWFCDSNIQEGLMGSDHCPVYATMKERITVNEKEVDLRDVMNPPGTFADGKRLRDLTLKDSPVLSGRLIPEFDRRRSIRDMFSRKLPNAPTTNVGAILKEPKAAAGDSKVTVEETVSTDISAAEIPAVAPTTPTPSTVEISPKQTFQSPSKSVKRSASDASSTRPPKRSKSSTATLPSATGGKGQQSLKGFFAPKTTVTNGTPAAAPSSSRDSKQEQNTSTRQSDSTPSPASSRVAEPTRTQTPTSLRTHSTAPMTPTSTPSTYLDSLSPVHDPIVSKESWSKLFSKPPIPRCEGHDEPCISLLTKKPGINCGRSFWMCSRPLGPTGQKEKGTQWRCGTFIWASDWGGGGSGASGAG